jgi:hypothetical protein
MTRKHFRIVATEIASMTDRKAAACMADSMARMFQAANPRFDRGRFMVACGLQV